MIKCPYCGRECEGNKFCPDCGTALVKSDAPDPEQKPSPVQTSSAPVPGLGFYPGIGLNITNVNQFSQFSAAAPAPNIESDPEPDGAVLLIDCYTATVATIGGDRYSEIVLNRLPDGREQLDTYESDFRNTVHRAFPLDAPISGEAFAILREEGIDKWHLNEPEPAMCGGVRVIRYRDGENLRRIANEQFPGYGETSFFRLSGFLYGKTKVK